MIGRGILLAFLVLLNLFLVVRLMWTDQGVFAYLELKNRYEVLHQRLENVDAGNMDLSLEIRRLKTDRAYQEKVIRERMNFIKKDEILYIFPEAGTHPNTGDATDE
ncbi:FtsB family cell division protein [Pseudodesulfovibrio tunisiensis]|uniref:FtsB family cell division protein n=1 Tax=Pseudodesulfovibrio tunisiensis TaxID=463192 RepID=UPI001FB20D88|nr:septum formation initiator family protein [Pseudodesulfovibrio tunisiensis]